MDAGGGGEKKGEKNVGMVTLPELYSYLKDCNPFSMAAVT